MSARRHSGFLERKWKEMRRLKPEIVTEVTNIFEVAYRTFKILTRQTGLYSAVVWLQGAFR
jgi:hypothetical protein